MDGLIICLLVVIIALQVFFRPRKDHSDIAGELKRLLDEMQRSFERIEKNFREDFRLNREEGRIVARDNREELTRSMNEFRNAFDRGITSFNALQREKFANLDEQQRLLVANTEKRLEEIRLTVDEKLQKTLNDRIGQSFRLVTEQLESVQKGLGEMQTLAQDVGGLKRVLSNVKTRGNIGEIQLSMLLEQILAPEQYARNVCTKKGSAAVVEFAIKLPGDGEKPVWLPVDSKYPGDAYEQLLDAYDTGDAQQVEQARRVLRDRLRSFAKDIHDKYIDPPNTTDFALMFLPVEGLYAEAVRLGMIEQLQKEFKVNLAGPTTTAALLNSLQLGFRTLAVQKRSAEVWKVLGAVKSEFSKFALVLEGAQKRLNQANEELDKLVGVRTRQIQRTLREVELPAESQEEFLSIEGEGHV